MHDVRCSKCEALLCTQEAGIVTIKGKSEISFKPAGTIKAKCKCGKINTIVVQQLQESDIYGGASGLSTAIESSVYQSDILLIDKGTVTRQTRQI